MAHTQRANSQGVPGGVGHNSGVDKSASAQRLKSFIERCERLQADRENVAADIREVLAEAKAAGYDPKIMRQVMKLRKMDAADRQEQESLLQVYMDAVGL